jgi:hypothetical protein
MATVHHITSSLGRKIFQASLFLWGQGVNMMSLAHKPKMTPSSYGNTHVLILLWPKQTNKDIMALNWNDFLVNNQCGLLEIMFLYKYVKLHTLRNIVASM